MASYSGTVKKIYRNKTVLIRITDQPMAGDYHLTQGKTQKLTGPGITLSKGDRITVEVENGKFVSIKKN